MKQELQTLSWLSEQIGMSRNGLYRAAEAGRLAEFGVFKLAGRWMVSVPAFRRAAHLDVDGGR